MSRESHFVELVDADGAPAGSATVAEAHTAPGRLHRAFSVLLVDGEGRLLLQRRSAAKTRFALHWANACCGHPAPGQPVADAAAERLREELGVTGVELRPAGVYTYRAEDPRTRRVEHEYDHVLIGQVPDELALWPDPTEVSALRWADPARLRRELEAGGEGYAPWLAGVFEVWDGSLAR